MVKIFYTVKLEADITIIKDQKSRNPILYYFLYRKLGV